MRAEIENETIRIITETGQDVYPIGSPEAFHFLSKLWLRSGWDNKYVYSFSWLGRPIIQLPEDIIRIQEVIYDVRPTLIIETGVAHGGSLVYYASIFEAIGSGRVLGVDIEIRPHNRVAIENHHLAKRIKLVEGSSTSLSVFQKVEASIRPDDRVLVILDSNHSKEHVLEELRLYSKIVSIGSYIVVCDGIMQEVVGAPRTAPEWKTDNPITAINEFLHEQPMFQLCEPTFPFNEGAIDHRVTYWPNCYLKRVA